MLEEARNHYIKACQFDERNIRMWYQRGMFEIRLKLPELAQPCFERGLSCPGGSDDPRCWHGIGRCYIQRASNAIRRRENRRSVKGINESARQMFEKGFINNTKSKADKTHNALNWYYLSLMRFHLAESNQDYKRISHGIQQGLELDPSNSHLLQLREQVNGKITNAKFNRI